MLVGSMREYFRETLQDSLRKKGLALSHTAQVYVVNLLTEFARSDHAFAGTDRGERPILAELMARAQDSEPHEALRLYKHMGDSSLYLSGFFPGAVERGPTSVDYYVSVGGSAQGIGQLFLALGWAWRRSSRRSSRTTCTGGSCASSTRRMAFAIVTK